MKPTDKATADSRSVQSFAIIKNTGSGNFVIGRFHARATIEMDYPSETSLLRFFLREGGGVRGLSGKDSLVFKLSVETGGLFIQN